MYDLPVPNLSASQLSTWSICPHKWYLEKVERVPCRLGPSVPIGSALNDGILEVLRDRMNGEPEQSPDSLAALVELRFDHHWKNTPLHFHNQNPAEERQKGRAKARAAMLCWHQNLRNLAEPVALEQKVEIEDPTIGRLLLYIDCLEDEGVTDWKFRGASPKEESVHWDHQLTTYAWGYKILHGHFPETLRLAGVVCSARAKTPNPKPFVLTTSRDESDVACLHTRFESMCKMISTGNCPPTNPSFSNFCGPRCAHWQDACPFGRRAHSAFGGGA